MFRFSFAVDSFNQSSFFFRFKKHVHESNGGCCCIHEWIFFFMLFNCYFSVLDSYLLDFNSLKCFSSRLMIFFIFSLKYNYKCFHWFFFSLRYLRLLLYRKPAEKEMTTRRFLFTEFVAGGRLESVSDSVVCVLSAPAYPSLISCKPKPRHAPPMKSRRSSPLIHINL